MEIKLAGYYACKLNNSIKIGKVEQTNEATSTMRFSDGQMLEIANDQLVYCPPKKITVDQLEKLVRLQLSLNSLLADAMPKENIIAEKPYVVTLDDLYVIFKTLFEKDYSYLEFSNSYLGQNFSEISDLVKFPDVSKINEDYEVLEESEQQLAIEMMSILNDVKDNIAYVANDRLLSEDFDFSILANEAKCLIYNRGKELLERKYTDLQLEQYVDECLFNSEKIAKYSEDQLKFLRRSVLYLKEEGYESANRFLAFAYAKGDMGFDKDYVLAESYLRMIVEDSDFYSNGENFKNIVFDAANLLGDIYYNGYNDEKDIVLAYNYYSMAALAGNMVAKTRLAAISLEEGPYLNHRLAEKLLLSNMDVMLNWISEDYYNYLVVENCFLLAKTYSCYLLSTFSEYGAIFYLLLAKCLIDKLLKYNPANLKYSLMRNDLLEFENQLAMDDIVEDFMLTKQPDLLKAACMNGNEVILKLEDNILNVRRKNNRKLIVNLPDGRYCALKNEVDIEVINCKADFKEIVYDDTKMINGYLQFYYHDCLVGKLKAEMYHYLLEEEYDDERNS